MTIRAWQALGKRVAPPAEGITLENFVEWVQEASGLDVLLDRDTLADEGVALDAEANLRGIRSMSIENLLRHVLTQRSLRMCSKMTSSRSPRRRGLGKR